LLLEWSGLSVGGVMQRTSGNSHGLLRWARRSVQVVISQLLGRRSTPSTSLSKNQPTWTSNAAAFSSFRVQLPLGSFAIAARPSSRIVRVTPVGGAIFAQRQ
jgi:hypothetical protein